MSKEQEKNACDWLENLEGDAWADACEEIAASVQKRTEQAEGAQWHECTCPKIGEQWNPAKHGQDCPVHQPRAGLAQPFPAPELERPEVMGWRDRILAAHPGSDPRYWPDALLVQHMTAEIADLRAAQARPLPVHFEHIGSLISVFRNATRDDANNGGREYFEKARSAEKELRQEIDRIVGALRAHIADLEEARDSRVTERLVTLDRLTQERDAAQARLAELETQEPVALASRGHQAFWVKWTDAAASLYGPGIKLYAAPVAQAGQAPQAWLDVQAERRRQVADEGWTPEHDNEHDHGQMARAAACYALAGSSAADDKTTALLVSLAWPWDQQWWKPRTARDNLVRAGALVLAEIERLDRAQAQGRQAPEPQTTGHDRLWHWFGLSRSAYAIMPRVMMHAMPDDWQDRMATLLEEWMAFWPNMPDIDACVQIRRAGRMIPTPPWLLNYRHPDRQHLADIHGGALERPSCVEP